MPACGSTSASAATRCCGPRQAIAACSAPMGPCRALRSSHRPSAAETAMTTRDKYVDDITVLRPRVCIGESITIGPGKIDLLKQVEATRSISAAARVLGMSYKHAWSLIDSLRQGFGRPVVATATGGKGGGGAALTELGTELVKRYGAIEACVRLRARAELEALRRLAS